MSHAIDEPYPADSRMDCPEVQGIGTLRPATTSHNSALPAREPQPRAPRQTTNLENTPVAASTALETQYRWMLLARLVEQRLAALYRQGLVPGGAYLGTGQEALSAAVAMPLKQGDYFAPLIRDMAGRLAFGETIEEGLRVCMGKSTSCMRGRDGNVHRGDISKGLLPMISHLGIMISTVAGLLLAKRMQGSLADHVGAAVIGDGGFSTGAASEALNVIAIERLPVILVVADNAFAYSTRPQHSHAGVPLEQRGLAFGWQVHRCDGREADDSRETLAAAVAAARSGQGPQLVVADLLRLCGHGEHDDGAYMGEERRDPEQDCLHRARRQLLTQGRDESWFEGLRAELLAEIEGAVEAVMMEPAATPELEDWCIYADPAGVQELRQW